MQRPKSVESQRQYEQNPCLPPYGDGKMKKLMVLASAAGLAGVAMGVSSGVVGYMTKGNEENAYRFLTSMFQPADGETAVEMQDFQMDATVGTGAAQLKLMSSANAKIASTYVWVPSAIATTYGLDVPEKKNGVWASVEDVWDDDEEDYVAQYVAAPTVAFDPTEAAQLYVPANKTVTLAGAVTDDDITVENAVNSYLLIGNPFVEAIDIQDLQLDETTGTGASQLKTRSSSTAKVVDTYVWVPKSIAPSYGITVPTGKNGVWTSVEDVWDDDEEDYVPQYVAVGEAPLDAGEAVQLYVPAGKSVKVISPYSL